MKDLDLRVFGIQPDGIIRYCMEFKDSKRIYGVSIERHVAEKDKFTLHLSQKSKLSRNPNFDFLREKDLEKLNLDVKDEFFYEDKDLFRGREVPYSSFNSAVKKIKSIFKRFDEAQNYDYDNLERMGEELLRRFLDEK